MNSEKKAGLLFEKEALKEAFPYSLPILPTYILMGGVFGIMMANEGYSVWISLIMSVCIYAGAMQYVAVSLLASGVPLHGIVAISLGINARQFFYAIASLQRYNLGGWRKWYLIFSVTDETFALLNLREQQSKTHNIAIDSHSMQNAQTHNQKVMFYLSFLNHFYWIVGCVGGTLLGSKIAFIQHIKGLDFIIIATFVVLLYENLKSKSNHLPIFIGCITTFVCLIFDRENFLSYSLIIIVCLLLLIQKFLDITKSSPQ